jgi:hypothetical protein
MRDPNDHRRPDTADDDGRRRPDDPPEDRHEPAGASRQVERGGADQPDVEGLTTDGEFGPGSD